MNPLLDLATFPANQCPNEDYLSEPVEVFLRTRRRAEGHLFEFNGPRGFLTIQLSRSGKRVKIKFSDIKLLKFEGKIPRSVSSGQTFSGLVTFKDDSEWRGDVIYYLNDRYGLHVITKGEDFAQRYFFPEGNIKDQQVSALFGQMLLDKTGLREADITSALAIQKRMRLEGKDSESSKLGAILQQSGKISEEDVQKSLAEHLGLEFVSLKNEIPDQTAVDMLPEELCKQLGVIPIAFDGNSIKIAMIDPNSTEALNMVGFVTSHVPEPVLATQEDIDWALEVYFRNEEQDESSETELERIERAGSEEPNIKLVNSILAQGIQRGASDIHIRPNEHNVELLFRIDGVMTLIKEFTPTLLPPMVSRIKILSGMNIAERRVPQDGQARVVEDGAVIDMRVSIIPTVDGESVVIRILNTKYGPLSIEQLGFSSIQEERFTSSLDKAHGLILVTGPTGSGKSTTLYAALDILQKKNLSIITIENPVEFHISGIDQVQVNNQVGLTFARVLRNVLRHDPEVIMVGEIRDQETATISIQSAMTGHLVLSTLHTNSAIGSISRLLDMGAQDYILGPTLVCIVAQRLLKKVCSECRSEDTVSDGLRQHFGLNEDEVFYVGEGCDTCNQTGMKGRVGVYEVLSVSNAMKDAIIQGRSEQELLKIAQEEGMSSLLDNALRLAREGKIDLAQAYAISTDP